jgi:hypothetical protein
MKHLFANRNAPKNESSSWPEQLWFFSRSHFLSVHSCTSSHFPLIFVWFHVQNQISWIFRQCSLFSVKRMQSSQGQFSQFTQSGISKSPPHWTKSTKLSWTHFTKCELGISHFPQIFIFYSPSSSNLNHPSQFFLFLFIFISTYISSSHFFTDCHNKLITPALHSQSFLRPWHFQ